MSRQYDYYKGGFPKGTICLWVEAGEHWCESCLRKFGMLDSWADADRFRPVEDDDHFDEYPSCVSCGRVFDYMLLTPEWQRNELLRAIKRSLVSRDPRAAEEAYRKMGHYIADRAAPAGNTLRDGPSHPYLRRPVPPIGFLWTR